MNFIIFIIFIGYAAFHLFPFGLLPYNKLCTKWAWISGLPDCQKSLGEQFNTETPFFVF